MPTIDVQPYGTWKSPITSSAIVQSARRLGDIAIDGGELYWNESRPEDKGRSIIVRYRAGKKEDLLEVPYSARTHVHEYGGGSFTVHDGVVYFSNDKDHGFYRRAVDGKIEKISSSDKARYANPIFDSKRKVLYAIQEEHRSKKEVINTLVRIGEEIEVIHAGHDFYSMPALHLEGTHLAFITWDHPNMPWDGSTLWVGELAQDGSLKNIEKIAGGENESIFQPEWSPDGTLYYVSDKTGWWNIYLAGDDEPLCPMEAEFGQPHWVFKMSNYGFLEDGRIGCVYTVKGTNHLGILDPNSGHFEKVDLPYTSYGSFCAQGNALYFIASSPKTLSALMKYDAISGEVEVIQKSQEITIDPGYISAYETVEFETTGGKTAYGFYYPPKNKDFEGDGLPPLIVKSHGGPTANFRPQLNLETQFWTSRGIGVLDVNYGGSTGYGREYRERLRGNWGIVDVDDCIAGALFLADRGQVDREMMVIKGASAGGYTTLAALTFHDVFKGGASYYGISDLEGFDDDTHKFESHYNDGLVGPFSKERSPINYIEKLSCPVILLQGDLDKVVPSNQSEKMFEALKEKKIPTAYLLFKGEGHGFRRGETIKKALEAELYFYGKIFGFTPSDSLEPIKIENLP